MRAVPPPPPPARPSRPPGIREQFWLWWDSAGRAKKTLVLVVVVFIALVEFSRIVTPAERQIGMASTVEPMPVVSVDEPDAPPALDLGAAPTFPPEPAPTPILPLEAAPLPDGVPDGAQAAIVERIVDGDTIWILVEEPGGSLPAGASHTIRLLEMDAPETQDQQECWGREATAFIQDRLPEGTTVYLEGGPDDTDQYGRFLRYVWLDDGSLFNEQAVMEGHAAAAVYEPNDLHVDRIATAEERARNEERGMWGTPCDQDGTLARQDPVEDAAADREPGARPGPERAAEPEPEVEPEPAVDLEVAPAPDPAEGPDCHPSYRGACVPITSDVDCLGGSGNGPAYVGTVEVVGPDEYGLDSDHDGLGCEDS